jgi:osmotically-inducible protein OsmY
MLTGHADSHKEANEAAKLAWKVKGAKEVINEVEVGKKKFRDSAADALTISAIRSKLLLDGDINSVNYGLDVNNGVAYVLGIAQSNDELDKVLETIANTKGVKRVVSHVILKDDARRKLERKA